MADEERIDLLRSVLLFHGLSDVDLASLARRFRLSGGNIRNVALAAAFAAAQNSEPVSMDHLLHGIRREYQKFGKTLGPAELLSGKAAAP